jgi:hypothetical protein
MPLFYAEDRRRLVALRDQLGQAVLDLEQAEDPSHPFRTADAIPRTRAALRVVELHLATLFAPDRARRATG